jgi:DNA-binding IclR family transcriptional regulator
MVFRTDGRKVAMGSSTAPPPGATATKSPPTGRVMDVLAALADSPDGRTSAELAKSCGISTSTCALVLAELEERNWVTRRGDRRYALGSGLFGLVHGLRAQFPLLDRGRDALSFLHTALGAGCSMSKIGKTHLSTVDAVGHGTDGAHAVGQRFPIGPPFGLVAMAWRDEDVIDGWLRRVTPRLTDADIAAHRQVLADIRGRGYGAWRFDAAHTSLHDRLAAVLASLEPTAQVTRELNTLMTIVTLQSVTGVLETDLSSTEFVVLPIFGSDGQPEYQIEIHLGGRDELALAHLDAALRHAQALLSPGVGSFSV